MKNITKLFAIAALAFTLGACSDDEPKFNPAPAVPELPVFFSLENETELEIFENTTSLEVPVYRKSAEGALTVPVTVTVTPDADGFSIPASVEFADGETEAIFDIALDMSKIKARTDYSVVLSIAEGVETPYYADKVTYTLNYSPWELVTGTDKDGNLVTKALFRDGIVATGFGLDAVEYEVEMQANPENPNIIRLVDPYGPAWPYSMYGDYDDSEHHYMYFNITNPNAVFLCDKDGVALGTDRSDIYFHSGLTVNERGEILITSEYNYSVYVGETPAASSYGRIAQGNLTFGEDQILRSYAGDPDGNLYYANREGLFRVIWPGAEEYVDPTTVWTPIGTGQFTDGILFPLAIMEDENEELPTYNVEVCQFGGDPNMFRIMNPWKAGVCPYGVDYSGDKYIELDTTNPECVMMELQSTGLSFGSAGALYITNYAYYLVANDTSIEDIIKQGVNDTYKDGVIYSAPGNLLYGFVVNGQLQGLNRGDYEWQLVMPSAPAEPTAKNAPAKVFNGNGPLTLTPRAKEKARGGWAAPFKVFQVDNASL